MSCYVMMWHRELCAPISSLRVPTPGPGSSCDCKTFPSTCELQGRHLSGCSQKLHSGSVRRNDTFLRAWRLSRDIFRLGSRTRNSEIYDHQSHSSSQKGELSYARNGERAGTSGRQNSFHRIINLRRHSPPVRPYGRLSTYSVPHM